MALINIHGASIHFDCFGVKASDEPPVLLIHGATATGLSDWGLVAPLLARRRHVIVPDCRGHGRSTNPTKSYHFLEMAADMAALVRSLGHKSAQIIGHSNGGNVALMMLVEHPQVVQSAIIQAANAFVSPDLIEKEPVKFDPERVAKGDPAWMEEMISLHSETHGIGYWRGLLELTVKEILREPNLSPEQLSSVQIPVLVIQGAEDPVNAPARHAQFIAENIPFAQQWIPAGVGHNVHQEKLFEWVEKVENFLDRRGEKTAEVLYRLGRELYPDQRHTVYDLRYERSPAQGVPTMRGEVLYSEQLESATQALHRAIPGQPVTFREVRVLLEQKTHWALVNRPIADLRRAPSNQAERLSQSLLGEALQILKETGDWCMVRQERDGYLGWMHAAALQRCSREDLLAYQASCQVRVLADLLPARHTKKYAPGEETGKLPFGVRLPVESGSETEVQVRLPDGRLWWVDRSGLLPFELCPPPNPAGIGFTLDLIKRFTGVPYLWGGRSPYGFDCSGFSGAFWEFMGLALPRDADEQYQAGKPVSGNPQPGDLLFFGSLASENPRERQNDRHASITHVAISLGNWEIIHANGTDWGVACNSLIPEEKSYRSWLREHYVGTRRFT